LKRFIATSVSGILLLAYGCNQHTNSPQVVRQLFVHKYGIQIPEQDWRSRGANGQIVSIYRDGTTASRTYCGGVLHGTTTYSFPHSNVISETEIYEGGEMVRKVSHYPSGIPHKELLFIEEGHTKQTLWYEDGTPQSIEDLLSDHIQSGEYFTPSHDLEASIQNGNGTRIQRDPYGKLTSRDEIRRGEMVQQTTYFSNGDPDSIADYKNGFLHGQRKTYLIGGEPNTLEEWAGGYQHGVTLLFQNGQKRSEILYVKGKKHGLERRFDDQGSVRNGPCKIWLDGIVHTEWYLDNAPVTQFQYESPRHLR